MWTVILAPETADIIRSVQDLLLYFRIEMRGGMSADIGGGGDDGMPQLFTERFAEGLIGDPDTDGAVFGKQVRRQIAGSGVDDGQGFFVGRIGVI